MIDSRVITKTHSASNVFSRTTNNSNEGGNCSNTRNSLNTEDYKVQYTNNRNDFTNNKQYRLVNNRQNVVNKDQTDSTYNNTKNNCKTTNVNNTCGVGGGGGGDRYNNIRRGSSAENVNTTSIDVNSNGNMKKLKYETEVNENVFFISFF